MLLKQIDRSLSYNYEFYLCRRDNREPIATLVDDYNINSINYSPEFRNVSELNFEVPFHVRDRDMNLIVNPIWNLIKSDTVIETIVSIGNEELFNEHLIVNSPKKVGSGDSKKKIVHCYGYEQSLSNIKLRGFQGTRQLWLSPNETVEIGQGILNILEEKSHGDFKVGYIDPMAMNETVEGQNHRKYRTFAVDDKSWLSFIRDEIESSYDCVFEFTYDRTQNCTLMNIYHVDNYGKDNGLYISEKNYIDRLEEDPNIDEMVTRLTIKGKDGLTINSVNLGKPYVEDFSYYRNLDYMSQDLLNVFNKYDTLMEQKTPIFKGYLTQLNDLTAQLNTKVNSELSVLNNEMTLLEDNRDNAISQGLDQTEIIAKITAKQAEIDAKMVEIEAIKTQINAVSTDINTLNEEVKLENNFTQEQLKIINRYLREATWSNENYFEVDSLLEAGKKAQKKMNEPLMNFSVDLPSFIDVVECQYDWKKLKIGDIVNLEYTLWNDFFQVRIVGYTHDISNKTLKIELSNRDFKYDSQRYISELSKEVSNTSVMVNNKKGMFEVAETTGNWLAKVISDGLDTATYKVYAGKNQQISIDERGIKCTSTDDEGAVRLLNSIIAISEDGMKYDLAMTAQGIIAKKLIGELLVGQKLLINNESGTVQINGDAIIIKTPEGVIKLKLGKLDNGNYGISMYNSQGQVVLDERGILQTNIIPLKENVDSASSYNFPFKLGDKVLSIRKAELHINLSNFRSYEKLASSGGSSTQTSSSAPALTTDVFLDSDGNAVDGDTYSYITDGANANSPHIHSFRVPHKHKTPAHAHTVGIPSHSHPLDHGIYIDSSKPTNVSITADGNPVQSGLSGATYTIDITNAINPSIEWHSLVFTSSTLGEIKGTLFIQYFVTF